MLSVGLNNTIDKRNLVYVFRNVQNTILNEQKSFYISLEKIEFFFSALTTTDKQMDPPAFFVISSRRMPSNETLNPSLLLFYLVQLFNFLSNAFALIPASPLCKEVRDLF